MFHVSNSASHWRISGCAALGCGSFHPSVAPVREMRVSRRRTPGRSSVRRLLCGDGALAFGVCRAQLSFRRGLDSHVIQQEPAASLLPSTPSSQRHSSLLSQGYSRTDAGSFPKRADRFGCVLEFDICGFGDHELKLNWFRARGTISAGIVEGYNNKAKLTTTKAYGY